MSKITDIHTALHSFLAAQLPNHRRLWMPYFMESNPEQFLRKGYGVKFAEANSEDDQICSTAYTLSRTFQVIISREHPAKDSDPARRESDMLELLEDLATLIAGSITDDTLGGVAINFQYASDGGLEFVFVENKPYAFITANFTVEYQQFI